MRVKYLNILCFPRFPLGNQTKYIVEKMLILYASILNFMIIMKVLKMLWNILDFHKLK